MILDNRFFLLDNDKWLLKAQISVENLKKHFEELDMKNNSAVLNTVNFDEAQAHMSESKINLTAEIEDNTESNLAEKLSNFNKGV